MGLLRTFAIILIIMMGLRLFRMYVAPYLMRKGVERMNQKMRDHMEGQFGHQQSSQGQSQNHREGNVTVEYKGKKSKSARVTDDTEYVEFEEID